MDALQLGEGEKPGGNRGKSLRSKWLRASPGGVVKNEKPVGSQFGDPPEGEIS